MSVDLSTEEERAGWNAAERLLRIARRDTGQSRRVADFLLAWHNSEENGGWNPTDFWQVDTAIAEDMLTVARFIQASRRYPGDLGFKDEITDVWRLWRGGRAAQPERTR